MSGPELAVDLRVTYPALPVLYMSGYTDDVLGSEALGEAHTGFIRKPFAGSDLVHAVRALLDDQPWSAAALTGSGGSTSRPG
jgi:FixJ family two-component response regulator